MHKNIKHIIAMTLVITAVSVSLPRNSFGFGSVKAYASTYNNAKSGELKSLNLTWGSGSEIKLYDNYYGDEVELSDDTEYYVILKSISGFKVSAEVKGTGYAVKVFTSSSKTEEGQDVGSYVKVNSSYEDIYLRTYTSDEAYEEAYNDGDVSNCEKTYVIHVRKTTAVSDTESEREYAYLTGINLSNGSIDFSKNQTSYNVNVDEDVDKLTVKATPDDDDDYVEINGSAVYKDDEFKKTINLNKGNNTVTIYVENGDDNDENNTYTLNVYRGKSTDSTSQDSGIQLQGGKLNSWQKVNGKWRYVDGTGSVLKNQWWFDGSTGANYYLKEDGYRATGWLNIGSNWYYFDENGEQKTGWVNINKSWYYLNKSGTMQIGWLEDASGNWYYLDSSGAMKTGWIESSDGKWYYLDSAGKMAKDTTVDGSKIDSNGVLVN